MVVPVMLKEKSLLEQAFTSETTSLVTDYHTPKNMPWYHSYFEKSQNMTNLFTFPFFSISPNRLVEEQSVSTMVELFMVVFLDNQ